MGNDKLVPGDNVGGRCGSGSNDPDWLYMAGNAKDPVRISSECLPPSKRLNPGQHTGSAPSVKSPCYRPSKVLEDALKQIPRDMRAHLFKKLCAAENDVIQGQSKDPLVAVVVDILVFPAMRHGAVIETDTMKNERAALKIVDAWMKQKGIKEASAAPAPVAEKPALPARKDGKKPAYPSVKITVPKASRTAKDNPTEASADAPMLADDGKPTVGDRKHTDAHPRGEADAMRFTKVIGVKRNYFQR